MLVLIMTVCTLGAPDNCGEARLEFAADAKLMQCLMGAPPYIAQWAGRHPGQRVTGWRFAYPEHDDQPA